MVVKARAGRRYELRTFAQTKRGWTRVRGLTLRSDDPYWMGLEVWRLIRVLPAHWRVEVRDTRWGKLAPILSHEDLLARARSEVEAVLAGGVGVAS